MANSNNDNLEEALVFFKNSLKDLKDSNIPFINSLKDYGSYINAIQNELNVNILDEWIIPRIAKNDDLDDFELIDNIIKESFEPAFKGKQQIGSCTKSQCSSALKAFARFILGQYKANIYLSLEKHTDEANCKLVAQYALFCTVDVAEKVRKGEIGSKLNLDKDTKYGKGKRGKTGNEYFSWFCCKFQRLSSANKLKGLKRGGIQTITSPQPDPSGTGSYTFDDNSAANQAIKKAVIKGFPEWMQCNYDDFEDYMACHIWDGTCYDYRFHTSVFNLVLLPKSIGGLTDYSPAVKEILQYEAAMRFGVYPSICSKPTLSSNAKNIYNNLVWRQPDEHNSAINRIKNKLQQPQPLK